MDYETKNIFHQVIFNLYSSLHKNFNYNNNLIIDPSLHEPRTRSSWYQGHPILDQNLYKMKENTQINEAMVVSEEENEATHLWNQRLSHMSKKELKVLINCKSIPDLKSLNLNFCKHCDLGKQCRQKFKIGSHTSKGILDYIHYVWGASIIVSFRGTSYFVAFIDD
jgi:hypothetical protein